MIATVTAAIKNLLVFPPDSPRLELAIQSHLYQVQQPVVELERIIIKVFSCYLGSGSSQGLGDAVCKETTRTVILQMAKRCAWQNL